MKWSIRGLPSCPTTAAEEPSSTRSYSPAALHSSKACVDCSAASALVRAAVLCGGGVAVCAGPPEGAGLARALELVLLRLGCLACCGEGVFSSSDGSSAREPSGSGPLEEDAATAAKAGELAVALDLSASLC